MINAYEQTIMFIMYFIIDPYQVDGATANEAGDLVDK